MNEACIASYTFVMYVIDIYHQVFAMLLIT